MNKIFTILILISSLIAQNKQLIIDNSYSTIEYEGSHFLHNWIGTSHSIIGSILIDIENPTNSKVDISIPIFSFDSNNGNRDSNMLFVVEEFIYPKVRFNSTSISHLDKNSYNVRGNLRFHGVEMEIDLPIEVKIESDFTYFKSTFSVNLNDYNVERPKLLLTPIKKIIEIRIQIRGSF